MSSVIVTEDFYPGSEAVGIQTMFRVTFNVVTEKVTFTLAACPSITWKVSSDMHHVKRLMVKENEYLNCFLNFRLCLQNVKGSNNILMELHCKVAYA